jgi:hypothetical protein
MIFFQHAHRHQSAIASSLTSALDFLHKALLFCTKLLSQLSCNFTCAHLLLLHTKIESC